MSFLSAIYQKTESLGHMYNRIKTYVFYAPFFKSIGKKCIIVSPIKLTPDVIELGNNVHIFKHARIEGIRYYQGEKYNPKIVLGDNVFIQQNLHLTCANSIIIEANTAIAPNVSITDIHHPHEDITQPPELQKLEHLNVEIGKNCKIYNNAVILPGVKLGHHNIVAANSVILKGEYPDYCVIGGIPGKILKLYNENKKVWFKPE
ncbi:acyltransferase [Fulvivirga sp.]|uniref:acyltransferase n=1 Tax=Fulvivirga sp. TaxID=1931237 RepID=UPI0032EBE029